MKAEDFIQMVVSRRKALGLSQAQLAELAETEQPRISGYERGENEPGLSSTLRIMEALGFEIVTKNSDSFSDLD